jgi:hypothetical protein
VITGVAATGADTTGADTTGADTTTSGTATESDTAGVESLPPTGATMGSRDDTSTDPGLTPTAPGATTTLDRRSRALPADAAGPAPPPRAPETAAAGESFPDVALSDEEPPDAAPPDEAPRPARAGTRDADFVDSEAPDPDPAASAEVDPAEPADPVVSANATGTDATAEPTPKATANAPTRPTYAA